MTVLEVSKEKLLSRATPITAKSVREVYRRDQFDKNKTEPQPLDSSEEYRKIQGRLEAYSILFRKAYLERVESIPQLMDLLGCQSAGEMKELMSDLSAWFSRAVDDSLAGQSWVSSVCPSCLRVALSSYSREGERIQRVCRICGFEVGDDGVSIEDYDQSLDRDVTFAPMSWLSDTKGLGMGPREQKFTVYKIINDEDGEELEDFRLREPEITAELEKGYWFVYDEKSGMVYCLMDGGRNVVRKFSFTEGIDAWLRLVNRGDRALRKTNLLKNAVGSNDLKGVLWYACQLCNDFGIKKEEGRDQAFMNTLGHNIRVMKTHLKAKRIHIPAKKIVDTLFYMKLLQFGKKDLAKRLKGNLELDYRVVNEYDSYKENLRKEVSNSPALLEMLEQQKTG